MQPYRDLAQTEQGYPNYQMVSHRENNVWNSAES